MELQQGFVVNGMGQRDPFAAQQLLTAHVRFGSKADVAPHISDVPQKQASALGCSAVPTTRQSRPAERSSERMKRRWPTISEPRPWSVGWLTPSITGTSAKSNGLTPFRHRVDAVLV